MDNEKLLYAMGEVDEEILYFKYHLKNLAWAVLMGIVTMILCLFVAERVLGVSGFVTYVEYTPDGHMLSGLNPHIKIGLWFRRICLVVIPLVFARKVRWRYTWVNFFVYFGLFFPLRALADQWPGMGYMSDGSGFFSVPWILNPIIMMFHFWGIQSLVYLAYNAVRAVYKSSKRTEIDKGV